MHIIVYATSFGYLYVQAHYSIKIRILQQNFQRVAVAFHG